MQQTESTFDRVIALLLTPVPLLPEGSFLINSRPKRGISVRQRLQMKTRSEKVTMTRSEGGQGLQMLSGRLERGQNTPFAIGGTDFYFDSNTWMFGEVRLGTFASVQAHRIHGELYAKKIVAC